METEGRSFVPRPREARVLFLAFMGLQRGAVPGDQSTLEEGCPPLLLSVRGAERTRNKVSNAARVGTVAALGFWTSPPSMLNLLISWQ